MSTDPNLRPTDDVTKPVSDAIEPDAVEPTSFIDQPKDANIELPDESRHQKRMLRHGSMAVIGLIISILLWIAVYVVPAMEFDAMVLSCIIMMAMASVAMTMSIKGWKSEHGVAVLGTVISGAFLLFNIIGLIGCFMMK